MRQLQIHSNEEQQQQEEDDQFSENVPHDESYEDVSDHEEDEETKKISLKVKRGDEEDNEETFLCIKFDEDVELRWLMIHCCDKVGLNYLIAKFTFNGAIIRDCDTPKQLSMVDDDVIYAFSSHTGDGVYGRSSVLYTTVCIRRPNQRDVFLRVAQNESILRQAKRHLSNGEPGKPDSTCFMLNGEKLTEDSTPDRYSMVDGDIIDAFDLNEISSSWSRNNQHLTV